MGGRLDGKEFEELEIFGTDPKGDGSKLAAADR